MTASNHGAGTQHPNIDAERAVTCCFTGHRPEKMPFSSGIYSYDFHVFRRRLEYAIQRAILDGYRCFITGMSRGMDLWAAMNVLDFKRAYPGITLEAAIPFPEQAARWNAEDIRSYNYVLDRCDRRTVLSEVYTPDCMDRRNRYMVDRSSLLIAAYGDRPGGTRRTCAYAARMGLSIVNILSGDLEFPDDFTV